MYLKLVRIFLFFLGGWGLVFKDCLVIILAFPRLWMVLTWFGNWNLCKPRIWSVYLSLCCRSPSWTGKITKQPFWISNHFGLKGFHTLQCVSLCHWSNFYSVYWSLWTRRDKTDFEELWKSRWSLEFWNRILHFFVLLNCRFSQ